MQWAAILASNILYEKFWQHNGVAKSVTGAWSIAIYLAHKDLHTPGLPHFPSIASCLTAQGRPAGLPWNHTYLIKARQSAKSTVALYLMFRAQCREADCPPMKPERIRHRASNKTKQGEWRCGSLNSQARRATLGEMATILGLQDETITPWAQGKMQIFLFVTLVV